MQLSDTLKKELYKEAQTNGFNSGEYLGLLTAVDNLLNELTMHTQEYLHDIKPNDYDVNGEEIK